MNIALALSSLVAESVAFYFNFRFIYATLSQDFDNFVSMLIGFILAAVIADIVTSASRRANLS